MEAHEFNMKAKECKANDVCKEVQALTAGGGEMSSVMWAKLIKSRLVALRQEKIDARAAARLANPVRVE